MNNIRTIFSADSLDSPLAALPLLPVCGPPYRYEICAKNLFLDLGDIVAELLSDRIRQSKEVLSRSNDDYSKLCI